MRVAQLRQWVAKLDPKKWVAVEEDGRTLVEIGADQAITGAYLEVGALPERESKDLLGPEERELNKPERLIDWEDTAKNWEDV